MIESPWPKTKLAVENLLAHRGEHVLAGESADEVVARLVNNLEDLFNRVDALEGPAAIAAAVVVVPAAISKSRLLRSSISPPFVMSLQATTGDSDRCAFCIPPRTTD
jgi:hypothetical protein